MIAKDGSYQNGSMLSHTEMLKFHPLKKSERKGVRNVLNEEPKEEGRDPFDPIVLSLTGFMVADRHWLGKSVVGVLNKFCNVEKKVLCINGSGLKSSRLEIIELLCLNHDGRLSEIEKIPKHDEEQRQYQKSREETYGSEVQTLDQLEENRLRSLNFDAHNNDPMMDQTKELSPILFPEPNPSDGDEHDEELDKSYDAMMSDEVVNRDAGGIKDRDPVSKAVNRNGRRGNYERKHGMSPRSSKNGNKGVINQVEWNLDEEIPKVVEKGNLRTNGEMEDEISRVIETGISHGDRVDFWNDIKCDSRLLKAVFPRVYLLVNKKSGPILEFGSWIDSKWVWDVQTGRFLFDWEKDQWCSFQAILSHISIRKHISDALAWKFNSNGVFYMGSFLKGLKKMVDGLCPSRKSERVWLSLLSAVVWIVWEFRKNKIFDNKDPILALAADLIGVRIVWWFKAFGKKVLESVSDLLLIVKERCVELSRVMKSMIKDWIPSMVGAFKFNVDGSARGNPGLADIGGVLRDSYGNVLCLFLLSVGITDSTSAELLAIEKAVELCLFEPFFGVV
ncbi:hypothetical protein Ddye_030260 [Dipteronia dyeriana]|uniref:RNase H type-1 domain-containing protein n=1 Tax=Dipteronia dyeriana TaxID=168575 RepID=A0AAD9TH23_9ROSI|nr:hypothetical protein Ddye_030260 [Dipteronia dyeriana]